MPVSWLTLYPDIPFDRQIDYNAQRLARTAINHAYWAANMAAAFPVAGAGAGVDPGVTSEIRLNIAE